MEFERQDVEMEVEGASDDSVVNQSRVKMSNAGEEPIMVAQPVIRNSGKGRYWECLKNHAVGIGGHALDGCGEFMAAGADGTLDALRCVACNCHRNFHRKETEIIPGEPFLSHRYQQPPFAAWTPAGYMLVAGQQRGAATMVLSSAAAAGGGTQTSRDDQEDALEPRGGLKKRFRTKFTQEQKDKMLCFAEKLGWRIQKQDENLVEEFCNEIEVKRQVLKVWMHNNKQTLGKKTEK